MSREVGADELRTALGIWLKVAPAWVRRDLAGRAGTKDGAERAMVDHLLEKMRLAGWTVAAPEPVNPFAPS